MSLRVVLHDGICELRLADPPGNVIDRQTCLDLAGEIRARAADPTLKAFLFTAEGKHFSYGASVAEHAPGEVERFLPAFHDVFYALAEASLPSIAAISGVCLGGAFELAAFCTHRIADATAVFGVPEIRLGVVPPVACVVLPRLAGGALSDDLVCTGRRMAAEEADRRGLLTRLCGAGTLVSATEAFLDECIRPLSAAALRLAVRASRRELHDRIRNDLPLLERLYLDEVMATRDAKEGISAFLEKRAPVWANR